MRVLISLFYLLAAAGAAEHRGTVKYGPVPIPGAVVTAARGESKYTTITDPQGTYSFPDLSEGPWTLRVEMKLFESQAREVAMPSQPLEWTLTLVPAERFSGLTVPKSPSESPFRRTDVTAAARDKAKPGPSGPDAAAAAELAQRAADGLLINGSTNNGAASAFAQLPAFGNNRRGQRSMYNGSLGIIASNAIFDARSYSLTGQDTPKPAYSRLQGLLAFGGPIKIPKWLPRNGPVATVTYQWTRNSNASTQTGLMPTAAERAGDFTGLSRPVLDPRNNLPFPGNIVPQSRISPEARALLNLYPLPNFTGSTRYNYQLPIVSGLHQDDLQSRVNKQVRKNFFSGNFAWQSTRSDTPDLFGFLATGRVSGYNAGAGYRRSLGSRTYVNLGYNYSRQSLLTVPYFANRRNVSAEAGIQGNNQDPVNWGPPALSFASGINALTQPQASDTRNQTHALGIDGFMNRRSHNLTAGFTHRRQQFNVLSQEDPRGTFAFTGAATGSDFAGFLLGVPDTSSIAFGNADKYLRAAVNEAFVNDDWRVNPGLTLNYGLRWEYWSPLDEKYGRLVNLAVGSGYRTAVPVVAGQSGTAFPQPDRNNFGPRFGFSWRPLAASSMIIRGGYGIYYDTSVYLPLAMRMAQQAPLSKSLRVANTDATPLTLAGGFNVAATATSATTFGVDPGFRIGYSQTWQTSLQRDLPLGLQMTATYNGSKGTRAQQQFLPNTFPSGAIEPSGFTYLVSNGNATRHAGQIQLRRRLRSGFTANLSYTYAKAIDNAALGGRGQSVAVTAQDWRNLNAERGRSLFDQRHLLTTMFQYTTGMGLRGGSLMNGWRGRLLKEWSIGSTITAGSGLPLTPVYLSAVRGTGVTGSLRPDYTGANIYDAPGGFFLNPAAVAPPAPGRWGNAGRNSITGPRQFAIGASLEKNELGLDGFQRILGVHAWRSLANSFPIDNRKKFRSVKMVLRLRDV